MNSEAQKKVYKTLSLWNVTDEPVMNLIDSVNPKHKKNKKRRDLNKIN